MKGHQQAYLIIGVFVVGAIVLYMYEKNKAASSSASSIVQGSGVLSVLPNTATTSTPSADATNVPASWNFGSWKKHAASTATAANTGSSS
jgi:hypothetical protein